MIKAMQYKKCALDEIIENYKVDPDGVSVNYSNDSVKLGRSGVRVKIDEWVVAVQDKYNPKGFALKIISDEIAQAILAAK